MEELKNSGVGGTDQKGPSRPQTVAISPQLRHLLGLLMEDLAQEYLTDLRAQPATNETESQ